MLDTKAWNHPKATTAVNIDQRRRWDPRGMAALRPPPAYYARTSLWGATFPVNRHINRPHTWKETRLWRRLLGSSFSNESDANTRSCSKMVSPALQETGHWITIICSVTQHYQGAAVWGCSAARPLVAGQTMTSPSPCKSHIRQQNGSGGRSSDLQEIGK